MGAMPISVFAQMAGGGSSKSNQPIVSVTSLYYFDDGNPAEYRALPDNTGNFYLDIGLSEYPASEENIVVYYRTVDDSAVAKWGDYDSVGALDEASVTLSKANNYTARVVIRSTVMDYGFISDSDGERKKDKLITRRFLFELTGVEGNAKLFEPTKDSPRDQSMVYCYLRANGYSYQSSSASANKYSWQSNMRQEYIADIEEIIDYNAENDPSYHPMHGVQIREEAEKKWSAGTTGIKHSTFYTYTSAASAINATIKYKGTQTGDVNLKFDDEWHNYVQSGVCNLGISINGSIVGKTRDSDGLLTFNLYYTYQGVTRIALTLYLEGEFDDSTFFGWEHAYEYAIEGMKSPHEREDHIDDNFIGYALYNNDGEKIYEVRKVNGSVSGVCNQLNSSIVDGYAVKLMGIYNTLTDFNDSFTAYYLKLPADFVLADSYSYELISDSTNSKETRVLSNTQLSFALMNNKAPMIAKDSDGKQMVSTNLDTIKAGDKLRMSVRFDRPVYVNTWAETYITADIYNDKGTCLAKGLQLKLNQLGSGSYYYAWDTLVFEAALPEGLEEVKIASLRNIKFSDSAGPIKSFFTEFELLGKTITDIYYNKDFRTPVANVSVKGTDNNYVKSKSLEVYVNILGNNNASFRDYVTVYYQWNSNPHDVPETWSSKLTFNSEGDSDTAKSIVGTGNGAMWLHLKTVSSYGKSSITDAVTGVYVPKTEDELEAGEAVPEYTAIGPFLFDNAAPEIPANIFDVSGDLKTRTVTIPKPTDRGIGLRDVSLYYIPRNSTSNEGVLLKKFTESDFGESDRLDYSVSHASVGVGVDADGNTIIDRGDIKFYISVSDNLGNTIAKAIEFKMTFDTNEYLDSKITSIGAYDIAFEYGYAEFVSTTEEVDGQTYIYNFKPNEGKIENILPDDGRVVKYGFSFTIDRTDFVDSETGIDPGLYGAQISYKGQPYESIKVEPVDEERGVYVIWFLGEMKNGRYDICITRTEGDSVATSQIYSLYATNGEADPTDVKNTVASGTLLTNSVYQLSAETPYFYYKDSEGNRHQEPYNGIKQPASFSSIAKAREYVYYMELGDIYIIKLTDATASALASSAAGYLIARGEDAVPTAGQYWIRYKSESWTPSSGDSAWVYYYYGMSGELLEESLSPNLRTALNAVTNRIVSYGKQVVLTDASLFLGSATGDKMLDKYGMPYLLPEQIHSEDEISFSTMSGCAWSTPVCFAKDSNIYKSTITVGGSDGVGVEYPIIGNFALPTTSRLQYMTYAEFFGSGSAWKDINVAEGEGFIQILSADGIYYIREMSAEGVAVYAIYVDKEAPKVNFSHTGDDGELAELPVDGVEILDITTRDLYIGNVAINEYDRLSYVAVYKSTDYSLVGVYTAEELSSSNVKLNDGNYYIVVSDRSGNHYTVTAKVSSSGLVCSFTPYSNRFIRLTCNRRADQILRYEVYLDGELITSTYSADQTFDKAGNYTVYIQDIYGNVKTYNELFTRTYPTVTWKYHTSEGKYREYVEGNTEVGAGFSMYDVSANSHKITASVKVRFTFSESYEFEFIGVQPQFTKTVGAETVVTIDAGQSFTLKVYYKNHKDCYTTYSCVVDVTPPAINVTADVDVPVGGENELFAQWAAQGKEGDIIVMDDLYYILSEIERRNVANGSRVTSDTIRVDVSDANELSLIEVYLDGTLIERQDKEADFSQITLTKWGEYRIVATDKLGNAAEFTFTNGMPDDFNYLIDGVLKNPELHGYLNFENVGGDRIYSKVDYGSTSFRLDVKQDADVFLSLGTVGGESKIVGFSIIDGQIYSLAYKIVLDKNGARTVSLEMGDALIDKTSKDFRLGAEYLISDGAVKVYASVNADKVVSIKVYASDDPTKITAVDARVEIDGSYTMFVSSKLSKKSSNVSFTEQGIQTGVDIRENSGFTVDESVFDSEYIAGISLYYSNLNDLDPNKLDGRVDVYVEGKEYSEEGFYLLIVRNLFGNDKIYRIAISRSFGVTSSVAFGDGHEIYYSKDYSGVLYSNNLITIDLLDDNVSCSVTRNGSIYTSFGTKTESGITSLVFSDEGVYVVTLTDSYGNTLTKNLEISKSSYSIADGLLTGFNEDAIKRDEGYTNQKISVNKTVFDESGIYYLAIEHGGKLTVLFDSFAETTVTTEAEALVDVIGSDGDGVYTVICRDRYGSVVRKDIHYRGTPTLKLERTTRSSSDAETYALAYAIAHGFWSNNTLVFSTEASTYIFTIDGRVSECPRTLVFDSAGEFGSTEYEITYVDEYGFKYSFKAYLVRQTVSVNLPADVTATEIGGILHTKDNISVTFGENMYATYTRNSGDEIPYTPGEILTKDGTYRFTVIDYAGNTSTFTIKKDTTVEFSFTETASGAIVQNGGVVNSSKVSFNVLNKDTAYIEKILHDGVALTDYTDTKFSEDGKWEIILCDELGNKSYFSFYILTHKQNGFSYTTPYEYRITEMWYDAGDGVKISYASFVSHSEYTSSFSVIENGKYTVVMISEVTGLSSSFSFTVDTLAPEVSLVGCNPGETTINNVSIAGCKVGDRIKIYRATSTGEELVEEVVVNSMSTAIPEITEGGEYRIVVESEAGVETELTFVRKHVMNTAGSVFIMVIIGLAVVGLFTGLVYRNKSKTDD